jgi:hypothetical protein
MTLDRIKAPQGTGAEDYMALCREIIKKYTQYT